MQGDGLTVGGAEEERRVDLVLVDIVKRRDWVDEAEQTRAVCQSLARPGTIRESAGGDVLEVLCLGRVPIL